MTRGDRASIRPGLLVALGVGVVAVILLAVLTRKPSVMTGREGAGETAVAGGAASSGAGGAGGENRKALGGLRRATAAPGGARAPEDVVAEKALEFVRSRRETVAEIARQLRVDVPPEVEQMFAALESGEFRDAKGFYNRLESLRSQTNTPPGVKALIPAIADAFGAAAAAKAWPAEELMAYGDSVLGALRPGSVYIAGTGAGRYILNMMGEGSGAARPVVMTLQNVTEPGFFDYLNAMHGGRLVPPADEDLTPSAAGQSPNPEDVLKALMAKNPGVSFAFEGTLRLSSLAGATTPLGPVLEMGAPNAGGGRVNAAEASRSVAYWQATAERLQAATAIEPDAEVRQAYAQLAGSQAQAFAEANLTSDAEQAFRAAMTIAPAVYEPMEQFVGFLVKNGRTPEALKVADKFAAEHPAYKASIDGLRAKLAAPPPEKN